MRNVSDKPYKFPLLWLCLAGGWTLFIWSQSMRPAVQSAQQSGEVLAWLMPLLDWTGLDRELLHTLVRKAAHMAEFALLGLLWTEVWLKLPGQSGTAVRLWSSLGFCVLTALADETLQLFAPGRAGLVADVWIDAFGAALGLLTALALGVIWNRKRY